MKKSYYPSQDPMQKLKQEMKLRNFSPKTVKSYLYYITNILQRSNKNPKTVNAGDIRDYLEKMVDEGKSTSTLNGAYSALKFYFEKILKRKFFINIPRAKKSKKLPVVLTKKEVRSILGATNNVKHKLILATMYSSGLRVSEVPEIKIRDLDLENNLLIIRQGKGRKDRRSIISKDLAKVLRKYTKDKALKDSLFESNRGGKLTTRSIQKVFSENLERANINKSASCHSLRHSFATHLLEGGINIRYIQELLGHARLETTQVYTKVAKNKLEEIKNPLD